MYGHIRNVAKHGIKAFSFLRKRPGLTLLVILLGIITLGILKPEFYFMGWDNFSSYLNLKSSLYNTIFATWREHRGLGVPSDAEINDLPRQLFSIFASLFVRKELIDQLYVTLMLWGGVLSMYALGRYVSSLLKQRDSERELFGSIAAFFYLFNLNTLAVFYFPMIMYITRFFMLPTTTYVLLRFIHERHLSKRFYLLAIPTLFVGFGAYMVPTIYIVTMMALGLMMVFFQERKRVFLVLCFFAFLGAYWILPFINYTIQKGPTVPKAPLFVIINEAMLNKSSSYYSFARQAKLRPSFFSETNFTNNALSRPQPLHELAGYDEKGSTATLLWIFPILYIAGIGYSVILNRNRILLWFAAVTITFLTLSMKEYSPLGFLYEFISNHLPFVNTVFRFGDTKFHAMIALGGSIVASALITQLYQWITRINFQHRGKHLIMFVTLCLGAALLVYPYKSYFTGNFIGFFMYNRIPQAYFDIADIINKDPDPVRVIHLPFDRYSYWKPYAWGYFGSSFLHFMLNKPLFDRAFEPASEENARIHEQLMDLVYLASTIPSDAPLKERAEQLYELLKSISVRYVIDDGTVSTNVAARNISYWGTIDPTSTHRLLEFLNQSGFLRLIKEYAITPMEYASYYAKLYPYNTTMADDAEIPRTIRLYQIAEPAPRVQLIAEANVVHSAHDTILPSAIKAALDSHYIQSPIYDDTALLYPFALQPKSTNIANGTLHITLPVKLKAGTYTMENEDIPNSSPTYLINVSLEQIDPVLRVGIEYPVYPTIEGAKDLPQKNYATVDVIARGGSYTHISIGNAVFPIPPTKNSEPQLLGSVLIEDPTAPIRLLYPHKTYDLSGNLVQRETNPQCLNDQLGNAASRITGDNGILIIAGQNVSNCLTTEVVLDSTRGVQNRGVEYTQLEFDVAGTTQSLSEKKDANSWKPKLARYVESLNNPLIMHVCIKPEGSTICMNTQSLFRLKREKTHYNVPIVGDLTGIKKLLVTFTVRSSQRQVYETQTTNIRLSTFTADLSTTLNITPPVEFTKTYTISGNGNLEVGIPIGMSKTTQMISFADDGILIGRDPSCDQAGKHQSTKESSSGLLLYAVGCKNIINRNIPFSSGNYYFWQATYKHLSGSLPTLSITNKVSTYFYNKLAPTGKNPDNYFSNPLQNPETAFSTSGSISQKLVSAPSYQITGYIHPRPELLEGGNKEFILEHFSQNEAVSLIESLSLIELPSSWLSSKLYPDTYQPLQFNPDAQVTSYTSLLPSLKRVTLTAQQEGEHLLILNEQYDSQWMLWNTPSIMHARCDGYANCYRVKLPKGSLTIYLFYVPEILNLFGFSITTLTILLGYTYVKLGDMNSLSTSP